MPYPLEEDIISASKAGFEGIEIWTAKLQRFLESHSLEDLKGMLDEYKLIPAALCPYGIRFFSDVDACMEELRNAARMANAIGCEVILACPDVPPPDMDEHTAWRVAGEQARRYGGAVSEYGVKVAIEPLGGHPFVPGPSEALKIVEGADHDAVCIMMDTFHYYKSGVTIQQIEEIPIEKLALVHVNDCEDLPRERLSDGHRLYTGLGVIPLEEMLGVIKRKGYEGYLSVEIFREEYWRRPSLQICEEAKKHLDEVLRSLE
jgi:2-keto-myo-inositol isomerase